MKKGSLNLSIQAIVIVVIAFVVLGLGLGFVRSQFGEIQKTSSAVQEQISQQILDELRTGNKKLSFPATKLTLETTEESVQAIGVKNTEDAQVDLVLGFEVKTVDGFKPFVSQQELDFDTVSDKNVGSTIIWDDSEQSFRPGEARVIPVTITAPDKTGNYLYKVVVKKVGQQEESSEDPSQSNANAEVFDTRTFFIKTS